MGDETGDLRFSLTPSRKGMKRFGISSLPKKGSILNFSAIEKSETAWVHGLLEKRIKYDLNQTIHAFINSVQYLLLKIEKGEEEGYLRGRQREAMTDMTQGENWMEKRSNYIQKFFNAFEKDDGHAV